MVTYVPNCVFVALSIDVVKTTPIFLVAGDARQNEQAGLIAIHTIFVRYHNYIARELLEIHSDWPEGELYQVNQHRSYIYVF